MIEDHKELWDRELHPILDTPIYQPPKPKLVFGIPSTDPLAASQIEARLRELFPRHDIVLLGGLFGMMEVNGGR